MQEVIFNDEEHSYVNTTTNETYISATQLLKKYGLSADYKGIPLKTLANAAVKGKQIHKELELYVQGQAFLPGVSPAVDSFRQYIGIQNINLTGATTETQYVNHIYKLAGTVDLQYYDTDGSKIIADYKTTSTLHIDAVAWQLSLYNYLVTGGDIVQYYFNKLKVFHIKDTKLVVKDVYTVDYDAIVGLLKANAIGDSTYTYIKDTSKLITATETTLLEQIMEEMKTYEEGLDKLKLERDKVLNKVKDNLVNNKEYRVETDKLTITYVEPVTRNTLNQKKVKELLNTLGENITDYMNTTVSADSIRVKLKEGDDSGD